MSCSSVKTFHSQRGAELVEFILTLPLILAVAFIMIEIAVAMIDQAALTNASRAAAREAIQGGDASAAAAAVFPSLISWSTVSSTTPNVTVSRDASCGAAPDPGCDITVTISYDFDFLLLPAFLSNALDIDLTATTVMREMSF
jgi:Flp pilus assembly protein TadG